MQTLNIDAQTVELEKMWMLTGSSHGLWSIGLEMSVVARLESPVVAVCLNVGNTERTHQITTCS